MNMARTTIKTDSECINKVEAYVRREADNYKAIYEKIYTAIGDIFSYEQWLGEDARKYNERLMEFKDNFKDLYNLFLTYANYLKKAAEAYDVVQTATKNSAGKLSSKK